VHSARQLWSEGLGSSRARGPCIHRVETSLALCHTYTSLGDRLLPCCTLAGWNSFLRPSLLRHRLLNSANVPVRCRNRLWNCCCFLSCHLASDIRQYIIVFICTLCTAACAAKKRAGWRLCSWLPSTTCARGSARCPDACLLQRRARITVLSWFT
jgi:hypothetical protein